MLEKAYAQTLAGTDYHETINNINDAIISPVILLMFALAIIYFLWGVFLFVKNSDSPEERKIGQTHMFFGILGIAIMLSAYGIINLILGTWGK